MDIRYTFPSYIHIYSDVKAYPLTPETRAVITQALVEELVAGNLASLDYTGPTISNTNATITYRYLEDTTDYTLAGGDYLVCLPTGKLVAMTAANFEQYYKEASSFPTVDVAIVDKTVLTA